MAALNFADLAKPVSADEPCGPDPDEDPAFMNVLARWEVALPASYFSRDNAEGRLKAFDRSNIDFPAAFSDLGKILKQSRDLRGFMMAGKLCLINRDIPGFAACLGLITSYLGDHWEEIYPKAEDGDFIMREIALQGLDENATIVLPLQHAPVFTSKRLGPVIFRSQLVATGEVRPDEDEEHPDAGGIAAALKEVELADLTAMLGHVTAIRDALLRLREIWSERLGADQAVTFPRLAGLVGQIIAFLEAAVERRAPAGQGSAAAEASAGAAAAGTGGMVMVAAVAVPAGACASVAEAQAALAGCLAYFRRTEPSSPAVLLIGQAQRLIGKSLIEVIQIMFPEHVDKAMLEIGDDTKYQLPLERLGGDGYDAGGSDDDSSYDDDSSGSDEDSASYDEETGSEEETPDEAGDEEAEASESADDWAEEQQPEAEPEPKQEAPAAGPTPAITVASRAEAIARMKSVAAFYRHAEPSNPVPLLMDKACGLAQQDFLSLLSDILPEVGIRQGSDE